MMSRFWKAILLVAALLTARAGAQSHLISLNVRDAALDDVILMLAIQSGKNIVASGSIGANRVTVRLRNVTFSEALGVLARAHDLQVWREKSVYLIGKRSATAARHAAVALHPANAAPDASATPTVIAAGKRTAIVTIKANAAGAPRSVQAAQAVAFDVRVADVQTNNAQNDVRLEFGGIDAGTQPLTGSGIYALTKSSRMVLARLSQLVAMGRAKILTSSKFVTPSDREADFLIGGNYPTLLRDPKTGSQQVQFIDVGVKLRLTPTIGIDGSVTAELHPEYSTVESSTDGSPLLAARDSRSTLRVRAGETILLGGFLDDIDAQTLTKLPLLGDIPVIGTIFRTRQHQIRHDEIIFLITPRTLGRSTGKPVRSL